MEIRRFSECALKELFTKVAYGLADSLKNWLEFLNNVCQKFTTPNRTKNQKNRGRNQKQIT